MKQMIQSHGLLYKYDLNVTKCDGNYRRIHMDSNDTKESTNATVTTSTTGAPPTPQVADVRVVWDHFETNGCTVRFLCPQKHHDTLHRLLSTMESEFGCMVGCNAYLTPGYASQGFAPHYDDIEAFILQLEGKKRWKVYAPLHGQETLPRISSDDFVMVGTTITSDRKDKDQNHDDNDDDDDDDNNYSDHQTTSSFLRRTCNATVRDDGRRQILDNPVLDVVLLPGDMLYIPRGWIHQAVTLPREKEPSLHLTISCMQRWAWADLMELIIPEALKAAVEHESYTTLREGLPRNFLSYMGVIHEEVMSENIEGIRQAEATTKVAAAAADVTDTNAQDDEGQENPQRVIRKVMHRKLFVERMKKCMHKVFHEESTMKEEKNTHTHIYTCFIILTFA
jgi:lysine-specific demethylase/histidyl-hydroxylase NO66